MYFEERDEGDYRIYAGAIELPEGGYQAAAVVKRVRGVTDSVEVFRDERMSGGHSWDDPERALHFALKTTIAIIRERQTLPTVRPVCAVS